MACSKMLCCRARKDSPLKKRDCAAAKASHRSTLWASAPLRRSFMTRFCSSSSSSSAAGSASSLTITLVLFFSFLLSFFFSFFLPFLAFLARRGGSTSSCSGGRSSPVDGRGGGAEAAGCATLRTPSGRSGTSPGLIGNKALIRFLCDFQLLHVFNYPSIRYASSTLGTSPSSRASVRNSSWRDAISIAQLKRKNVAP